MTERACLDYAVERIGLAVLGWAGFALIFAYLAIFVLALASVLVVIFLALVTIAYLALVVYFWRQGDTLQDAVIAEAKRLNFPPAACSGWATTLFSGGIALSYQAIPAPKQSHAKKL